MEVGSEDLGVFLKRHFAKYKGHSDVVCCPVEDVIENGDVSKTELESYLESIPKFRCPLNVRQEQTTVKRLFSTFGTAVAECLKYRDLFQKIVEEEEAKATAEKDHMRNLVVKYKDRLIARGVILILILILGVPSAVAAATAAQLANVDLSLLKGSTQEAAHAEFLLPDGGDGDALVFKSPFSCTQGWKHETACEVAPPASDAVIKQEPKDDEDEAEDKKATPAISPAGTAPTHWHAEVDTLFSNISAVALEKAKPTVAQVIQDKGIFGATTVPVQRPFVWQPPGAKIFDLSGPPSVVDKVIMYVGQTGKIDVREVANPLAYIGHMLIAARGAIVVIVLDEDACQEAGTDVMGYLKDLDSNALMKKARFLLRGGDAVWIPPGNFPIICPILGYAEDEVSIFADARLKTRRQLPASMTDQAFSAWFMLLNYDEDAKAAAKECPYIGARLVAGWSQVPPSFRKCTALNAFKAAVVGHSAAPRDPGSAEKEAESNNEVASL